MRYDVQSLYSKNTSLGPCRKSTESCADLIADFSISTLLGISISNNNKTDSGVSLLPTRDISRSISISGFWVVACL